MADLSDDKKVRELMELDVHEVSLVDRPAIQRKFCVVKREQESTMAETAKAEETETAKGSAMVDSCSRLTTQNLR